jgi:hypothetical protein
MQTAAGEVTASRRLFRLVILFSIEANDGTIS